MGRHFKNANILLLIKKLSLDLAPIDNCCLIQSLLWWLQNYFPTFSSHSNGPSAHYFKQEISLPPCLFLSSFSSHMDSWILIILIVYNLLVYLIILGLKLFQICPGLTFESLESLTSKVRVVLHKRKRQPVQSTSMRTDPGLASDSRPDSYMWKTTL